MNLRTITSRIASTPQISSIEVALLERLFDLVNDMVFFVKDRHGRYVSVNQSLIKRHGLKSKLQAIGKRPTEICSGEFGQIPTQQDRAIIATGRAIIDHLEMQWHVPNDPVWCLTTKLPILDETGAVTGIVGFSRDVRAAIDQREVPKDFARTLEDFENQLSANVTPAWLARHSELSPQRLARLIRRIFDLTPGQLIAKTRISAASRMLLETEKSVAEIALACGFYDHSAFSRAFRLATGTTPSEFRTRGKLALESMPVNS